MQALIVRDKRNLSHYCFWVFFLEKDNHIFFTRYSFGILFERL